MPSILDRIKSFFSKKKDDEYINVPQNITAKIPTIDFGVSNLSKTAVKTPDIQPIDLSGVGSNLTKSLANLFKIKPEQKPTIEIPPSPKVETKTGPTLDTTVKGILESPTVQNIRRTPFGKVGIGPFQKDISVGDVSDTAGFLLQEVLARPLARIMLTRDRILTGKPQTYTPKGEVEKIIMGKDELGDVFEEIRKGKEFAKGLGAGEKTATAVGVPLGALSLLPIVGGGKGKIAVKTTDELASVLQRGLKIKPIVLDEGEEAVKVAWKEANNLLKKVNVDKDILKKLKTGEVISGENYVIQKQGNDLLANIDESFTPPSAKLKPEEKVYEPTPEEIEEVNRQVLEEGLAGAKQFKDEMLGDYKDIATKMRNFLRIAAEKRSSKESGELFREHIPSRIFGVSSDEVASALGKSESEFMAELTKDLDIISSGKGNAQTLIRINNKVQKIKNSKVYDKLDPQFYNFVRDWENQVKSISVEATPETLAKVKAKEERLLKPKAETPEQQANRLSKMIKEGTEETQKKGMSFEATPETLQKVKLKEQKETEALVKNEFDEWEKALFRETGAEEKTIYDLSDLVKTNTISPMTRSIDDLQDIGNLAQGLRDVYRNFRTVFGKHFETAKRTLLDPFDEAKGKMIDELTNLTNDLETVIVKGYGIKKGSKESAAVQQFGEGKKTYDELIRELGKEKADNIVKTNEWMRQQYDRFLDEVNAIRARIYPDQPDKIIPKRQDYYRHFRELEEGFGGFINIFDTPAQISSKLAGISEYVKPKSKFLSFAQKRLGGETTEDAIGGFLDYIKAQSYAKHIDPFIGQFRALGKELAVATETGEEAGKLNNFIKFLDHFTNDLAGKTNPGDRIFQEWIPGGRLTFRALTWLNSRVKANVILGNIGASIAQLANVPAGIASAGVDNAGRGIGRSLAGMFNKDNPMRFSNFLKERYFHAYDRFDTGILEDAKKFGKWMIIVLDEVGTKAIWNMHYEKAIAEGMENAIKYADDVTRDMVAGRGIGEVPLAQKAKVFQMVAPFMLEVTNLWWVMKDFVSTKNFGALATLFVSSYIFNRAMEQIRGSAVIFDPIQAMADAFQEFDEENDKLIGTLKAGGRLTGEVLANIPVGQTLALAYPEAGFDIGDERLTRKEFFGREDPTRFGGGALFTKGLTDPLFKVAPPFGGEQIRKTFLGIEALAKGYVEDAQGLLKFPVEETAQNILRGLFFGRYSFPEARRFYREELPKMSRDETIVLRNLLVTNPEQAFDLYEKFLVAKGIKSTINDISEARQELILEITKPGISQEEKDKALEKYFNKVNDVSKELDKKVKGLNQTEKEIINIGSELQLQGSTDIPVVDISKIPTAGFGPSGGSKGVSLGRVGGKGTAKPKGISITSPTKSKGIKFSVRKPKISNGFETDIEYPQPPRTLGINLSDIERPQKIKPRKFRVNKFRVV